MQQLLQMMQKISAEPNNMARSQSENGPENGPEEGVNSESSSDDYAVQSSIVDLPEASSTDSSNPPINEPPQSPLNQQQEPVEDVVAETSGKFMVVDDQDTALRQADADDADVEEIVVDAPVVRQTGGVIKRWIKRAVSWVKRLVGF
ncbi:MAG: hypothetical protein AB8B97_12830 [Granulosicoccus sp.]